METAYLKLQEEKKIVYPTTDSTDNMDTFMQNHYQSQGLKNSKRRWDLKCG